VRERPVDNRGADRRQSVDALFDGASVQGDEAAAVERAKLGADLRSERR
jgi:hypothetical protein